MDFACVWPIYVCFVSMFFIVQQWREFCDGVLLPVKVKSTCSWCSMWASYAPTRRRITSQYLAMNGFSLCSVALHPRCSSVAVVLMCSNSSNLSFRPIILFGLYTALYYFLCFMSFFVFFSLFVLSHTVYIWVFSVNFRQYKWPSGPSINEFK